MAALSLGDECRDRDFEDQRCRVNRRWGDAGVELARWRIIGAVMVVFREFETLSEVCSAEDGF